jgi:hypothetical protein
LEVVTPVTRPLRFRSIEPPFASFVTPAGLLGFPELDTAMALLSFPLALEVLRFNPVGARGSTGTTDVVCVVPEFPAVGLLVAPVLLCGVFFAEVAWPF